MKMKTIILSAILISLLTACAGKDTIIPQPEKNMESVYNEHMKSTTSNSLLENRLVLRRTLSNGDVDLANYTRTEKDAIKSRFKLLPNPIMYMYIAPHLSTKDRVPVPGYLTEFKMWQSDNYALPGEVSDMDSKFE